jgi:hypothetical protein
MHTFLSLDMSLIPAETKANIPTFWLARFSNDGVKAEDGSWATEPSRILIDGYNQQRKLVHPESTFNKWLQWSENPQSIVELLLDTAIEYTAVDLSVEKNKPNSIWYVEAEDI